MPSYRILYQIVQSSIHATTLRAVVLLLALVSLGCSASSSQPNLNRYEYSQLCMGVKTTLTVYAPDQPTAEKGCIAAFNRLAQLEDIMSDYRPKSEVMQLCTHAGNGQAVKVSDELFDVLQKSQDFARRSNGAFDITVGPLVSLWRTARKVKKLPTTQQIEDAKKKVGYQYLLLNPNDHTVQLLNPGMKLDLGGIGKGYAGDAAILMLKQTGLPRALFEAGGDIVAGDPPPGKNGWTIEIIQGPSKTPRRITIRNSAISTSGDTEQFVEIDGKHYSHVLNPHTGLGLTDRIEATVTAPTGTTADALSKPATILGPERGAALVRSYPGTTAYIRRLE